MSDETEKPDQTFTGHFTMQAVGGSIGYMMFTILDSFGIHAQAGNESVAGTFFGASMMAIWWLCGPRLKRWRNRQ